MAARATSPSNNSAAVCSFAPNNLCDTQVAAHLLCSTSHLQGNEQEHVVVVDCDGKFDALRLIQVSWCAGITRWHLKVVPSIPTSASHSHESGAERHNTPRQFCAGPQAVALPRCLCVGACVVYMCTCNAGPCFEVTPAFGLAGTLPPGEGSAAV